MKPCFILPLLSVLATAGVTRAAVTLSGSSSFNVGTSRYTYSYSVINSGTADELIQVTFPVSSSAALLGLTAPVGFQTTYDTVASRVNFIWDSDDFTPQTFAPNSTVSGFSFTSPVGPGTVPFVASDVNEDFTGFTTAPVPEPSVFLLGLTALPALTRRRRTAASSTSSN